jgi:hypothetical protein
MEKPENGRPDDCNKKVAKHPDDACERASGKCLAAQQGTGDILKDNYRGPAMKKIGHQDCGESVKGSDYDSGCQDRFYRVTERR